MRISPIVLLLFAMLGCGSGSQPTNEVDSKAQEQDVETNVENKNTPATPVVKPVETQEQAITAIMELGGRVSPDKPVIKVDFSRTKVTDSELEHLKGMSSLKILGLDDTKVTNDGVKNLKTALPNCLISH